MQGKSHPRVEKGIVVGNTFDKYGSRNPIVKKMMGNFLASFDNMLSQVNPQSILEVGCGEGHLTQRLLTHTNASIRAIDISDHVIEQAMDRTLDHGKGHRIKFENINIFDIQLLSEQAELVVCCEVLEHLEDPTEALGILARSTSSHAILSVPNEPLWRFLNMARLKYLSDFGNTPGHLQHWSTGSFLGLVCQQFDIIDVQTPIPWTFVLAKKKCCQKDIMT